MIAVNLLFRVTVKRLNLMKGATPSELVKGVTATRMTIGRKTEPSNKLTITSQSLPFLFWSNDILWIGAETTPFHHYVNCEFS
ncbi:hypothetical protein T4A_10317 [Trichinella pseudospiralis]|uniref:Uncharacterized protein n=1 Tax=Trichinella pseudospiralis TaxID=6337 RepID=A0A0V1EPS0_TRIPS|nr:hypothetical protein T4A_10317 [Trichinella pseudospiralis]